MRHVKLEEKFNSIQNLKSKLKNVFCLFYFFDENIVSNEWKKIMANILSVTDQN